MCTIRALVVLGTCSHVSHHSQSNFVKKNVRSNQLIDILAHRQHCICDLKIMAIHSHPTTYGNVSIYKDIKAYPERVILGLEFLRACNIVYNSRWTVLLLDRLIDKGRDLHYLRSYMLMNPMHLLHSYEKLSLQNRLPVFFNGCRMFFFYCEYELSKLNRFI